MVVDLERPAIDPAADGDVDNVLQEDERARFYEAEGEGVERGVRVRLGDRLHANEHEAHTQEVLGTDSIENVEF